MLLKQKLKKPKKGKKHARLFGPHCLPLPQSYNDDELRHGALSYDCYGTETSTLGSHEEGSLVSYDAVTEVLRNEFSMDSDMNSLNSLVQNSEHGTLMGDDQFQGQAGGKRHGRGRKRKAW